MPSPEINKIELRVAGPMSEISPEFLQGMVNRMMVSLHKYGEVADAYPDRVDATGCMAQRLAEYHKTGNTEHLIDLANYAMIEFMLPARPDAHFSPTDSDGSPGRISSSGEITHNPNKEL